MADTTSLEFTPTLEKLPPQEVLLNNSRISIEYATHRVTAKDHLSLYQEILDGNTLKTGWNIALTQRAIGANSSPYLREARLFTMDGAYPLLFDKQVAENYKKGVHHSYGVGGDILEEFKSKGISDQDMDLFIERIQLYWARLPFTPFAVKHEMFLLSGESFPDSYIPNFPPLALSQEEKASGLNIFQLEERYKSKLTNRSRILALGATVAGIASFIDLKLSINRSNRPSRRVFLQGMMATIGITSLFSSHQLMNQRDKLEAANSAYQEGDSSKVEQATNRFDAAMQIALKNVEPAENNVFRTLVFLAKTEEALARTDTGLPQDALALIVEGQKHLWDRKYSQEMGNPQKRAQFIRNHFNNVLVPIVEAIIDHTPQANTLEDRNRAIVDLADYIASVDITRINVPDAERFPFSLLDNGIFVPAASYKSPIIKAALSVQR